MMMTMMRFHNNDNDHDEVSQKLRCITSSTPSAMSLSKADVMLTAPRLMCSCRPQGVLINLLHDFVFLDIPSVSVLASTDMVNFFAKETVWLFGL